MIIACMRADAGFVEVVLTERELQVLFHAIGQEDSVYNLSIEP